MDALAPAALLVLLAAAGWVPAGRLARGAGERLALAVVSGAVVLHLALTVADVTGSAWSAPWVVAPLLLAAALGAVGAPRLPPAGRGPGESPGVSAGGTGAAAAPRLAAGWADLVAVAAVATFALLAWTRWIAVSDFVYHWGLKGHRFFLARGIDWPWLARPWNWVVHPDYPNLLPELYAAVALLLGRWSEPAALLLSTAFLALLLLVARDLLAALPPLLAGASLAALALALAGFGIGYVMAGAADWLIALAFVLALPPLLRAPDARGDLQVALCAAFAAGAKLEGLTLAAWLLLAQLARRGRGPGWSERARAALRLGLPVALVAVPWAARVVEHGLFQPFNTGSFDPGRLALVAPELLRSAAVPQWLGLPAALLALPLLARQPRLRAAAAVASLQLATYVWQYLTAPLDTTFLVRSTFPRLLLHLLPAVLLLAALAWLREDGEPPAGD